MVIVVNGKSPVLRRPVVVAFVVMPENKICKRNLEKKKKTMFSECFSNINKKRLIKTISTGRIDLHKI